MIQQWFRSAVALLLAAATCAPVFVLSDIVFENELIKSDEIFDLVYAIESNVSAYVQNQSKFYCVFRSNWNKANQPTDFPELARWGSPAMFSHTKQYVPFLKNREAPQGVEIVAEDGFTDVFRDAIDAAGQVALDYSEGEAFNLNQKDWTKNFQYLPAVNVSSDYNFLSGIASMKPSPDWFTGFYLHDTIKTVGEIYWERFKLRSYPWDAGTDNGQWYTDIDEDTDPPGNIVRMTVQNAPNGIFVNKGGDEVLYVAEWECILHTCPIEEPGCLKEDWPPQNGCDILQYPECAETCDPATSSPCDKCNDNTYHKDCCLAGLKPSGSSCDATASTSTSASCSDVMQVRSVAILLVIGTVLVLI